MRLLSIEHRELRGSLQQRECHGGPPSDLTCPGKRPAEPNVLPAQQGKGARAIGLLKAAFDDISDGSGSVLLVGGEAEVGKTRLIDCFLAGRSVTITVLQGGCDDLVAANPFGPLRDAVRRNQPQLVTNRSFVTPVICGS